MRTPPRSRFDRGFAIVVALKGLDGLVELLLGLLLLVAPGVVQRALSASASELGEGASAWRAAAASYLGSASTAAGLTAGATVLFLLVHGTVKLGTVVLLLKRLVRWYPLALAVLVILLLVQLHAAIARFTPGVWLLVGLDTVVILLVEVEYRRLRDARDRLRPVEADLR